VGKEIFRVTGVHEGYLALADERGIRGVDLHAGGGRGELTAYSGFPRRVLVSGEGIGVYGPLGASGSPNLRLIANQSGSQMSSYNQLGECVALIGSANGGGAVEIRDKEGHPLLVRP
jgi:hypothetical protein